MIKLRAATPFPPLTLDRTSAVPLHQQLYRALRGAILSGQLAAGTQLPATRTAASRLGLARTTVVLAYEQLAAEGYLGGRTGAGTYVADVLPSAVAQRPAPSAAVAPAQEGRRLSQQGARLLHTGAGAGRVAPPRAFRPSVPALEAFPLDLWQRLTTQALRDLPSSLLDYGDPAGYWPLREAIAEYLGAARAVNCSADQVIVVAGAQQGIDLVARVLLDPGDAVWVEDPGYLGVRGVLYGAGMRIVPVPVDAEGMDLAAGIAQTPPARMAYVTPSHQFPLGMTMSLARRLALLEWAANTDAWILEDDYDSEFRYAGPPLPALQGLDSSGRVLYVGTFSKVLFPALRLGYVVVPADLVVPFRAARAMTDHHAPVLGQVPLARFLAEGHFVRHLRRMRRLYAERQAVLLEAVGQHLGDRLEVAPAETGMHLIGWLPPDWDDQAAAAAAWRAGVETVALSIFSRAGTARPGVLLGYTAFDPAAIGAGARQLAVAWRARPASA